VNIRIPTRVSAWLDAFQDWTSVPIYYWRGWTFRRVDPLITLAFLFCVSYHGYVDGWIGAATGGTMFVFVALVAAWFL